jgi:hypothetical protein
MIVLVPLLRIFHCWSTTAQHVPCSMTAEQAALTAGGLRGNILFFAGPGQTAKWVVEEMGHPRIESISILLPDGTVFMTGGAGSGAARLPVMFDGPLQLAPRALSPALSP